MAGLARVVSAVFGSAKGALIALCVVCLLGLGLAGWRITALSARLDAAQAQQDALQINRDAWQASSEALAQQLVAQIEQSKRAQAAVETLSARLARDDETVYEPLRKTIVHAPATEDGEVAPVLRHVIEALP